MSKEFVDAIVAQVSSALTPTWCKGEKMTDREQILESELAEARRMLAEVRQRLPTVFVAGWNAQARHGLAITAETAYERWLRQQGVKV